MLPLIAMITMLIDHIGIIFFKGIDLYRIVGRLAFPLYCWFLVQGYRHTGSHKKYMWRLFWLACISQVPYTLALNQLTLNVIFTLLLSLIALYAFDRVKFVGYVIMIATGIAAAALFIPMDYGIYGVLLVFIYRYLNGWLMIIAHLLLNLAFLVVIGPAYWIQMYSMIGTLLVAFPFPGRFTIRPRWIYRTFYPVHLAVLYAVYLALLKP